MIRAVLKDIVEKPITGEWGTEGNSVNVLRTTNFTNEGFIDYTKVVKRNIEQKKINSKRLLKGDLIIEKSGGSPTQPVGRVVYFDSDEMFLCNNFTAILRPKKEQVFPKYLHYLLFVGHQFGQTSAFQNKTTGIINLQLTKYLEGLQIPLPPLPQQQKIANILDAADALRQNDKALLAKYDELTQALFLDMFGDPVSNPKGWEKVKLKHFGKISTGNTPSRANEENYSSRFIEWIKTDNIKENYLYVSEASEYLSDVGIKKARTVEKDAILVACIAGSIDSIGRAALTDRKVSFNQQINAIESNSKVKPKYLYYLIRNCKKHIQNHASNGMKRMLTKGEFEKILMILPPLTLQNQFAERVALIEEQKAIAQASLIKSKELFNSLLQKAFKGELA
jgi:type I restriction enzyme, S subunit